MTFAEIKAGRTYLKAGLVKASISCYGLFFFYLDWKRSSLQFLVLFLFFYFDFRQCDSPAVQIAGLDFSNQHRLTDNQHQHQLTDNQHPHQLTNNMFPHQLTNNQHPLQLTNNQQAIHASDGVQLSSALRRITGVNEAIGKYI